MKLRTAALVMLCLCAASAWAADDALGPARNGMIQCTGPKPEAKTCQAMTHYEFTAGGGLIAHDHMNVPGTTGLTIELSTPMHYEGARICGKLADTDLGAAIVMRDGSPANDADAASARQIFDAMRAPIAAKLMCLDYSPVGDQVVIATTLDGQPMNSATLWAKWIKPDEGYELTP